MVTILFRFVPSSSLHYYQEKFEPILLEVYVGIPIQVYLRDSTGVMNSERRSNYEFNSTSDFCILEVLN
jgi:hypothetical protein